MCLVKYHRYITGVNGISRQVSNGDIGISSVSRRFYHKSNNDFYTGTIPLPVSEIVTFAGKQWYVLFSNLWYGGASDITDIWSLLMLTYGFYNPNERAPYLYDHDTLVDQVFDSATLDKISPVLEEIPISASDQSVGTTGYKVDIIPYDMASALNSSLVRYGRACFGVSEDGSSGDIFFWNRTPQNIYSSTTPNRTYYSVYRYNQANERVENVFTTSHLYDNYLHIPFIIVNSTKLQNY